MYAEMEKTFRFWRYLTSGKNGAGIKIANQGKDS